MNTKTAALAAATLLTVLVSKAQQSPNPQPVPVQSQTAPCIAAAPITQKQQGSAVAVKPPTKWQQYLDAQKKAIEGKYGVVLPDTPTQVPLSPKPSSLPCPQAVAAIPVLKLPPDITVTLHCNPTTPSTKDAAHPTTLTLPDPHDFAVPKPGDFEADNVVPDLAAKTPCYLVKLDPKSQKSFVQQ